MDTDNFFTLNIEDSRIDDIKSKLPFAVQSGSAQNTYQSFPCPNPSASNIIWNVQVPMLQMAPKFLWVI
jgi:hypothetical protein